jgi:hypothetical protein
MIATIFKTKKMIYEQYIECIEACQKCATICNNCATAYLNKKEVEKLSQCIQLTMEWAVICRTATEIMSMGGIYSDRQCAICVEICNECADECLKHAKNLEQCRECVEVCRRCAELCASLSAVGVQ